MFLAIKDTFKGAFTFGISSSLSTIIGFVLIPLYTRRLSLEEFGLLGLVNLTTTLFSAIFGLGMSSAIFRSYFDFEDDIYRDELTGTTLILLIFSGCFLAIFAAFGSEIIIARKVFHIPNQGLIFKIGLYTSSINLVSAIPFAIYRIRKQFVRFALYNFSLALFQIITILLLVVVFNMRIKGVVIGQLLSALLGNTILIYSIRNRIRLAFLKTEVCKLIAYGFPLVPGLLSFIVLNSGGLYFLQIYTGLSDVGIYNLALKIVMVFSMLIINPFQLIWPPMMFSVEKECFANHFYARMLIYVLYVSIGLGIVLSIFSPEIIQIIAPLEYNPANKVIFLLLIGSICFMAQNVFNVGFLLNRKTFYWSLVILIETVISIFLWYIFVPKFGIIGIAIGSVVGYVIGTFSTYLISRQFMKIQYDWFRVSILIFVFIFVVWISRLIPTTTIVILITIKSFLIIAYLILPFLLGFWREDELTSIIKILKQLINSLDLFQLSTRG